MMGHILHTLSPNCSYYFLFSLHGWGGEWQPLIIYSQEGGVCVRAVTLEQTINLRSLKQSFILEWCSLRGPKVSLESLNHHVGIIYHFFACCSKEILCNIFSFPLPSHYHHNKVRDYKSTGIT